VLHIVKTADGARWAALQAQVLMRLGIDVHVALPSTTGEAIPLWKQANATMHELDCSLPIGSPFSFRARAIAVRRLIAEIQPDLIHSHFVTTTLMLRLALGRDYPIPRLFQVPGPLHLEHTLFRLAEIATAGMSDFWIASSQYIRKLYLANRIPDSRVFLSYYGTLTKQSSNVFSNEIRRRFEPGARVIGNINYMYPPKRYLGQFKGLKRHEDVIDALGIICRKRSDVVGVLVGGEWGSGHRYERQLRQRAIRVAEKKILLLGRAQHTRVANLWREFDVAVHVPISENCGGVIEPLLAGVPIIASRVGGLPEVVIDDVTGWLVPPANPEQLADTILQVLDNRERAHLCGRRGQQLVTQMFDINRTAQEIAQIYQVVLKKSNVAPVPFDSAAFVAGLCISA